MFIYYQCSKEIKLKYKFHCNLKIFSSTIKLFQFINWKTKLLDKLQNHFSNHTKTFFEQEIEIINMCFIKLICLNFLIRLKFLIKINLFIYHDFNRELNLKEMTVLVIYIDKIVFIIKNEFKEL